VIISTRLVELVIDTVVCLTLAKWETVSGQFGGLSHPVMTPVGHNGALLFSNTLLVRGKSISLCLGGLAPGIASPYPTQSVKPSKLISSHGWAPQR
jgi:hypothetical protein